MRSNHIGAIVAFLGAIATAVLLYLHADPLFIWGGARCDVVNGTKACAGYPPSGAMIVVTLVAVAVWMAAPEDPSRD